MISQLFGHQKKPIVLAILSNHDKEDAKYDDKLIAEATKIALGVLKEIFSCFSSQYCDGFCVFYKRSS